MLISGKIATILGGRLYGSPDVIYQGCSIDSRKIQKGQVFVAIAGEKTDGHQYITSAFKAGAALVIAETAKLEQMEIPDIPSGAGLISVGDTLRALQDLAGAWRNELNPIVIGISGSSGKTTTKDMVAAVLAKRYQVHRNMENFNNEIGLPLTILSAPAGTEIMVLEMGMRGLGQIRALCEICRPSMGVITNIGTTHMELLGSPENIAEAKWELIECLPDGGTAILNAEDYWSVSKAARCNISKVFYGIKGEYTSPDVRADNILPTGSIRTLFTVVTEEQKAEVHLPLPGDHHVMDALAALAVGLVNKIPLLEGAKALEELKLSKMRLEMHPGVLKSTIINDVYNANPDSMKASLSVLAERGGDKTIAVLGEMYELGDFSVSGHRQVGETVAKLGIKELITVGKMTEDIAAGAFEAGIDQKRIHHCEDCEQAVKVTMEKIRQLGPDTWVLVKGSRGMQMERVSELLIERPT